VAGFSPEHGGSGLRILPLPSAAFSRLAITFSAGAAGFEVEAASYAGSLRDASVNMFEAVNSIAAFVSASRGVGSLGVPAILPSALCLVTRLCGARMGAEGSGAKSREV
jgi:hypothetical protein